MNENESIKDESDSKKQRTTRILTKIEQTDLFDSIKSGNDERAKELIGMMDDVNEELRDTFRSGTPLDFSCRHGSTDLVKFLVDLGANFNEPDESGESPLMAAAYNGKIETVRLLIDFGVDLNYTDEHGSSALSYVSLYGNTEIFELLVSSGIDVNICGGKALIVSTARGNINVAKRLLELNADVNYVDSFEGSTPLHWACRKNNFQLVELLLNGGAEPTIKDKNGKTPIQFDEASQEIKGFIKNYNSTKFVLK